MEEVGAEMTTEELDLGVVAELDTTVTKDPVLETLTNGLLDTKSGIQVRI
jgi:hypothetical protein